ncbi:MAG TPA: glycosyltransferase, partial [Aggregatilineaceae bacterium]|nr:glycosyltransferase [Aggregatilineaceae bacterium]
MGFRFQRITTYYDAYLDQFNVQNRGLPAQPYAVQHHTLIQDRFGWSDFWEASLERLGYETTPVVIANAESMQKQWAAENNVKYSDTNWMSEIMLAQISTFKPDILFLQPWSSVFGPHFIRQCRALCPSIKLVFGWCGEAHPSADFFQEHDLVFTCAPDTLTYLQSNGIHAAHLNHAFEPQILEYISGYNANTPRSDVGFIGQILSGADFHNNRALSFARIARQVDIALYGYVPSFPQPTDLKSRLSRNYYKSLRIMRDWGFTSLAQHFPRYPLLARQEAGHHRVSAFNFLHAQAHPPIFGLAMYRTMANFKICLNAHGPSEYASNQRLYEATGVGTCLLTDWKDNLPSLFEPDKEVVTYRSAEEA